MDKRTSMAVLVIALLGIFGMPAAQAAATLEQSANLEQVSQAVTHLDEMTQQNSTLVEENAAASESLQQQANSLVDAVAIFRIRIENHCNVAATSAY